MAGQHGNGGGGGGGGAAIAWRQWWWWQRNGGGQLGTAAAARRHQRQHHGGSLLAAQRRHAEVEVARDGVEGDGHNRDPSVAAEGLVLMTPGPRAGVGQGPHAHEVKRRVRPIASGPVEVGGEAR